MTYSNTWIFKITSFKKNKSFVATKSICINLN